MSSNASAIVTISNRLGLHARPAMLFVETASSYKCDITVKRGSQEVNGKSIMQMMMLAATRGTQLEIIAEGPQADKALEALADLISRGFDED